MKKFTDAYESAWKQIIVPDKFEYQQEMGPQITYNSQGDMLKRIDFKVKNASGQTLQCFIRLNQSISQCEMPCIVYLHSHSGTRTESQFIEEIFSNSFNICSFDFSGYGSSEGEYSTLGMKEHNDLRAVVDYLKEKFDIHDIFFWGRSMGAVTAILFSHYHSDIPISGMVLDSPFTEAKTMICDLITSRAKVPRFLIKTALLPIAATIKSKTKHDVLENNPIEFAGSVKTPAFLFVAKEDKIARPDRVHKLYESFARNPLHRFELIEGEHNSFREDHTLHLAHSWMKFVSHGTPIRMTQGTGEAERWDFGEEIRSGQESIELYQERIGGHGFRMVGPGEEMNQMVEDRDTEIEDWEKEKMQMGFGEGEDENYALGLIIEGSQDLFGYEKIKGPISPEEKGSKDESEGKKKENFDFLV